MSRTTIERNISTEQLCFDNLAVFSVNLTKAGQVRSIESYVCLDTGEIIPAEQLNIPILDLRVKIPARCKALQALRPEVQAFARFILRFANKRRGITPGIQALCEWYATLYGKQSKHVRRYIPVLIKARILAGENLLGPLFQRTGGRTLDYLSEETNASEIYSRLVRRDFQPSDGKECRTVPPALVALEVARLDAELEAERHAEQQTWAVLHRASVSSETALYAPA